MIACLDVDYGKDWAYAAGVVFNSWTDAQPLEERVVRVAEIAPYQPGQFFRRELPCLLTVLPELSPLDVAIVDGYVWLDASGTPGLGAHLYEALERKVAIIGVAKTKFRNSEMAREIRRGRSTRPLYITAAGISLVTATECIASMHGAYRIPTLLKRVDFLCRNPN